MADFLKSAFGMLGGPQLRCRNDFVGQVIELGNQKLRVKRLIAEGVFHVSGFHTLYVMNFLCFAIGTYIKIFARNMLRVTGPTCFIHSYFMLSY